MQFKHFRNTFIIILLLSSIIVNAQKKQQIFEIRAYVLNTPTQESKMDNYLKNSLLPALKRNGIMEIGVFKLVGNDTLSIKKIYLFIPYKHIRQFEGMEMLVQKDVRYKESAKTYLSSEYNQAPFARFETILLKSFSGMPFYKKPKLFNERSKRIYELRSYEGPTEALYRRKVHMFNEGGEIELFERLGFNAMFYGSVISGSRMPNLMYLTSFEDLVSRDEHWKTFSADSEWKKLAAMEYYKHTVSKNEKIFLYPTEYSDL